MLYYSPLVLPESQMLRIGFCLLFFLPKGQCLFWFWRWLSTKNMDMCNQKMRPVTFPVNKIVQWLDESLILISELHYASEQTTKKTRLLTGFGAVMTTLISFVHKADCSLCDSAGSVGFYTHTLAIDSFPSVKPFFSPFLHPSSPFTQSSFLSENNPAIRCVSKQDHELIFRTSQSHRPTWRHVSLVCLSIFYSLWGLRKLSDILMGFESLALMFMSLFVKCVWLRGVCEAAVKQS